MPTPLPLPRTGLDYWKNLQNRSSLRAPRSILFVTHVLLPFAGNPAHSRGGAALENRPMSPSTKTAPRKGGLQSWLVLAVFGLLATGAGFYLPHNLLPAENIPPAPPAA